MVDLADWKPTTAREETLIAKVRTLRCEGERYRKALERVKDFSPRGVSGAFAMVEIARKALEPVSEELPPKDYVYCPDCLNGPCPRHAE